jgi:hypothetical protein
MKKYLFGIMAFLVSTMLVQAAENTDELAKKLRVIFSMHLNPTRLKLR